MVKIKTKKQLNLPQLIEWAWGNSITNLSFRGHGKEGHLVVASFNDKGEFASEWCISKDDVFEIETEEEITEDTHLDYLYALTNDDEKEIRRCMNFTIRNASMVIGRNDLTFFTSVDNDLVKIYENGKLVE